MQVLSVFARSLSMSSQFHESRGDDGISDDRTDVTDISANVEDTDKHDTTSLELDPLTSPVWVADDEDVALAPPLEEFEALYEADQPGGPEPIIVPGVDEIISGEYTGWVPIIGPDTLPDGSTRADQYRVTENVDPIKDAIAKGLEPSAVTGAYEVRKDAVVTKFDDFVDDPDQLVVSPAQALEEARRRIEEMRASLKVNVTEVAATITGEFIPTSQTSTNVVAEPTRVETPTLDFTQDTQPENDVPPATMIRDIPKPTPLPHQRIHPIPVPQPPVNPIVEAIVGPEPVFDQNEPTLGVDDVYSSIIFERIAALRIAREQLEAEAQGATSIAAPVVDADEFDTVALNLPKAVNPERDEPGYVTGSVSVADEVESAIEEIENFAEEFTAPEIDERINFVEPAVTIYAEDEADQVSQVAIDSDVVAEFIAEAEPEIVTEIREEVSDIHTTGAYLREILEELKNDNPVEDQVSVAITPPVVAAPASERKAVEPTVVDPQASAHAHDSYEDLFGGDFVEETSTPIFDAVTEIVNLAPQGKHVAAPAQDSEIETELESEVSSGPEPQPETAREFNQDVASQDTPRIFAQTTQKPTIIMHEEQQSATQLELVIMRDEIQDLRNRLDANQKLVEDLMVRLSDLAMAALTRRD